MMTFSLSLFPSLNCNCFIFYEVSNIIYKFTQMCYTSWKKLYMPKGGSIAGLRLYCLAYLLISCFCLPFLLQKLIY